MSSIDDIYAELDKYVGLDFIKEHFAMVCREIFDAEDMRRMSLKPDKIQDHYIFSENPGTGKTTVGELLGSFYRVGSAGDDICRCLETHRRARRRCKGTHGEKIKESVDRNALLYIDEAY